LYWIRLLSRCNLLSESEARSLHSDCSQLLRMMISVCKTIEVNPTELRATPPSKKGSPQ
jgi:hypothetical protein